MKAENNKRLKEKKNWILLLFKESGQADLFNRIFYVAVAMFGPVWMDHDDGNASGNLFQICRYPT